MPEIILQKAMALTVHLDRLGSGIIDMNKMFTDTSSFNGDMSKWDFSSVIDMSDMFWGAAAFNGDISKWDVSQRYKNEDDVPW